MTYTHRRAWPMKLILALLVLPLVFLLAVPTAQADPPSAGSQPEAAEETSSSASSGGLRIVPRCATAGTDIPQLGCVLLTLGNIAQLILALTGGLALLMFVYGGFLMLSSGGSSDKVTQGKNALRAAIIGLVIVLLAGYLIRWGLDSLDVDPEGFQKAPASTTDTGTSS